MELKCAVTFKMIKAAAEVRLKLSPFYDEFHGPRSDTNDNVALKTTVRSSYYYFSEETDSGRDETTFARFRNAHTRAQKHMVGFKVNPSGSNCNVTHVTPAPYWLVLVDIVNTTFTICNLLSIWRAPRRPSFGL
ncbi:hypothetical protein TNCV_3281771 [Trichonephila clavipes]|nr:hypothetical protein TNCV_3281771 [Trichonephila clavipes]